jgi:outer membrane lipoprotein-sorting protein
MRCFLTLALAALVVCPAGAEQNEAEKLFRAMEQKVRDAKTLRVRFDLSIIDALDKEGKVKGALVLGEGDKYRVEGEGKLFGEAVKFTEVGDGADTFYKDANDPKRDSKEKTPKGVGPYLRGALPREGFFLSTLKMTQPGGLAPDAFHLSGFKDAGKEKVGERNTQAIEYTATPKGPKDSLSMKMWLDAETHLPVKLAVTGGESDVKSLTETYSEFVLDPEVDAKSFEAPK